MPHYADGTEAKVGDLVHGKTHASHDPMSGYVVGVQPAATSCNAYVAVLRPLVNPHPSAFGTILSVGDSSGAGNRFFGYVHSEIANCSDLTLIFRKDEPATPNETPR